MQYYAAPLEKLIEQFQRLPGIGHKTAQRLAFYVLGLPEGGAEEFAQAILDARGSIHTCKVCQNLTEGELCPICADTRRDGSTICVVTDPKDLIAIERTREYHGLYHVLHGAISPMDGVGPEDINLKQLIMRLQNTDVQELILATNPNIEGEATAMYIARLIKPSGIKVSRIANGIPVGGDLEYADEVTLLKAMEGRREL